MVQAPRRILVADDDHDSAWVLVALLRAEGHEVAVANSGSSAIETASSIDIDLAFLDLRLSDMEGYDVAREIRRHHESAVLVALTGLEGDFVRQRCRESGFDSHIRKPLLDFSSIRRLVHTLDVEPEHRL